MRPSCSPLRRSTRLRRSGLQPCLVAAALALLWSPVAGGAAGASATGAAAPYVALGDSYSSGQLPPFVPGGQGCYRSQHAYPVVYDPGVEFWACSGATITSVIATQLSHVGSGTRLVTLTVGGNDAGLFDDLQTCVARSVSHTRCAPTLAPLDSKGLEARLVRLYRSIAGRAPKARLLVLTYPNPLPARAGGACPALGLAALNAHLLAADIPALHRRIEDVDATIAAAVTASGVARLVDARPAFAGHDACARSAFFSPLALTPTALHPNAAGQRELARLLARAAGTPPAN